MAETTTSERGLNKAKQWQVALFPFNNAATNCYLALMSFIAYYGGYYLFGGFMGGVISVVTINVVTQAISFVVMGMRIFDGLTDPPCGSWIDRTRGKFGKFRPFMVGGNILMAISCLCLFFAIRYVPYEWLRWVLFIVCYIGYTLGYTAQCACTKAGQTCITNDPHQRSQFAIWDMIGMIGSIVLVNAIGSGLLPMIVPGIEVSEIKDGVVSTVTLGSQYNPQFYNILVPIVIVFSFIYTAMAVFAIWSKDNAKFWGVDANAKPATIKDYAGIIKGNSQIRWLVLSSGFNKLASTIATSGTVAYLLYDIMMKQSGSSYNGLYLPIYVLSFVFMGAFFLAGTKTASNKGQKRAIVQYTAIAFLIYIGLVIMLLIWDPTDPDKVLTLLRWDDSNKMYLTINLFTICWIVLYGCGYGAYNCCSEMCIPMVADCTDYETYRSGNYVPGIMGTIFSLIDKLVSSLATVFTTIFTVNLIPGLGGALPSSGMDTSAIVDSNYAGVRLSAIITICLLPMISWIITLISMHFYELSGEKLREIQAVNAVRKEAIAGGMSKDEAMKTWTEIDQVPAEFIPKEKVRKNKKTGEIIPPKKDNFFDKLYQKVWCGKEKTFEVASSKAIAIPEQYRIKENEQQ
ncbi:MAG: MFS transporter [Bacilli bacterium]|jgi:Na+/melibiose symporter-like transporter|nr:MFS transporter [Bacilli bacterium]MCH4278308.1 MFS transporter [Bacilli bacterium]